MSDVTIRYGNEGERTFHGHRIVLASQSDWFKAAFTGRFAVSSFYMAPRQGAKSFLSPIIRSATANFTCKCDLAKVPNHELSRQDATEI